MAHTRFSNSKPQPPFQRNREKRIWSLRVVEGAFAPPRPNQCLYRTDLRDYRCDPEGTFGRNQQLTDSMSLSPLYSSETSDLHVNNVTNLQCRFQHLRCPGAKFVGFRVSPCILSLSLPAPKPTRRPLSPCGKRSYPQWQCRLDLGGWIETSLRSSL